jgi:LmbE family N-acetylglucosaminyl deacetylase
MTTGTLAKLPDDWSTGLAIVAHPDDLEYGAASAIAKWTDAGKTVHYLLVTRGEAGLAIPPTEAGPLREEEERASAAVVGVDVVEFLDHRDGVVEHSMRLRRDLSRVIRRHRPDVVIGTNFRDTWGGPSFNMADHRNVGLAALDAIRDAANPWIFPELLDEGLEPWSGVAMACFNASPMATHYVDIGEYLDRGVASLEQHRAYLDHVGGDARQMLTEFAESAGAMAGVERAVLFEVIRP